MCLSADQVEAGLHDIAAHAHMWYTMGLDGASPSDAFDVQAERLLAVSDLNDDDEGVKAKALAAFWDLIALIEAGPSGADDAPSSCAADDAYALRTQLLRIVLMLS